MVKWLISAAPLVLALLLTAASSGSRAEINAVAVTLDNDLFVGNDNGYSNGIFFSAFDTGERADTGHIDGIPEHDFWVWPLLWSLPGEPELAAVNSYNLGKTMMTPSDITIANPDENELPYSAILFLNNSYLSVNSDYADKISTTVGVVGPIAFGEDAQK